MRTIFLAAACAAIANLAAPLTAEAQSCEAGPQVAAHRTANGAVRAQYNALSRGEWYDAANIGETVVDSGVSNRHKVAAYSNQCGALAMSGAHADAISACDAALDLRDGAWRALNNRGVARWLSGDRPGALADFQAANTSSSGEDEVEANLALTNCM